MIDGAGYRYRVLKKGVQTLHHITISELRDLNKVEKKLIVYNLLCDCAGILLALP